MNLNNHKHFQEYIIRTPLLPLHLYLSLVKNYSQEALFETIDKNVLIKSAIALASPDLWNEFERFKRNPTHFSKDKRQNLEFALLKYVARITSRATPFGLFAGCAVGNFSNETKIILENSEKHNLHSQFDMQFETTVIQSYLANKLVRNKLLYFPNNSLYEAGNFYRYVEYHYEKLKRNHVIAAIRKNEIITAILENSKHGIIINELSQSIIDDTSELEEATDFIHRLIDNQILISELDTTITGESALLRLIEILELNNLFDEKARLIKTSLQKLQETTIENHQNIFENVIKNLPVSFNYEHPKYLVQTDAYPSYASNILNVKIAHKIKRAITFLNAIKPKTKNENLEQFKRAFFKRYETKEMPLAIVLDGDIGIGYLQNSEANDSHPILDRFSIPNKNQILQQETWTSLDYFLEKKLQYCIENNTSILELNDADFPNLEAKKEEFSTTFSVMAEILVENNKELIAIDSIIGNSALRLIGRFCNGNESIKQFAEKIATKEQEIHTDKILAEVVHIANARAGNVLRRPVLRNYEIPYLAKSNLAKENVIEVNDLTLSIVNDRIVLKSKKLQKEIIPCLSSAHNYSNNALPVYQFLCDLQAQNTNVIPLFDWGILNNHYNYFPRVVYKEVILAKAKWQIYEKELHTIDNYSDFLHWKIRKQIPKLISIVKGDNTLLLDLEQEIGFKLLKNEVKNKTKILLEEFLDSEITAVKDHLNFNFMNQIIVSFYNNK